MPIAETALTLAMLQLALSELGIAWLPFSLVSQSISRGDLVRIDDRLPAQKLDIKMIRLRATKTEQTEAIWHHLATELTHPAKLEKQVTDGKTPNLGTMS